jgi:glutamate 5-kinase
MSFAYKDEGERARVMQGVRRLVVKVGTRLLADMPGVSAAQRIQELVDQIAILRQRGLEVILVSSGAIGAGMGALNTTRRPTLIPALQAHAAVGQCRLMYLYETACAKHGFVCGQLLLTAEDVRRRERNLNISCCLDELLTRGVLPVINENDSVSVHEIKFGDNDTLAALVGTMTCTPITVLLTTIDGMRERTETGLGERLSVIHRLTPRLRAMAGGTDGNKFSVGGMATKLGAADLVTKAGEALWIADGHDFSVLSRIADGADTGTLFLPPANTQRMPSHKRFLAFCATPAGDLVLDAGAARAIHEQGRSLLPSGVREVRGAFKAGSTVRLLGPDGTEIARGICNFSQPELDHIKGHHSNEVAALLGHEGYEEVVHRNRLVLTAD